MRKELGVRVGDRRRFRGRVERFGKLPQRRTPTIMLQDVVFADSSEYATDHIWFKKGKAWDRIRHGDVVEFDARIAEYEKGWRGRKPKPGAPPPSDDYLLQRPTKVQVVTSK